MNIINFLKKNIDIMTLKFILVGILNTLIGTGLMFVLYNLFSVSYWVSSASNYIVGSIFSYFMNKYFTFQNKTKSWKIVAKFTINILVCYLIGYGLAKPLVHYLLSGASLAIRDNVAMAVGMCLFVVLNYFGQRFYAFKKEE